VIAGGLRTLAAAGIRLALAAFPVLLAAPALADEAELCAQGGP
jgi:hypothetical protein